MEALVEQGLARLLAQMSAMATPTASARRSPFECKFPPGISIHAYVARLLRLSQCSAGCVVLSLVYLDRLIKRHRWIAVSPLTCHRLVLTSIVVAIKFYDDTYFSNKFYSQVGGVSLTELNYLERQFLGLVDFKLCVEPREYELYRDILLKAVNTGMVGAAPDAAKGA
ncbi:unnamed protein product [Prorocentrum cordatum]|uniref:Cyclin n=1 Tax=Prorocentrum cordatum TaxID=2364126 RepID=A0ABN9T618_9DINO|nr:unnamed protein product [Polarella glacialis]